MSPAAHVPASSSMRLPVICTLVIGAFLTTLATMLVIRVQDRQIEINFQRDVDKIALDTGNRLKAHFDMLLSVRGLFSSSVSVERDEFAAFIGDLDLARRYPGFQAIQFVRMVPHAEHQTYVSGVRKDVSLVPTGYPNFKVWPESASDPHYVIEYCEPMAGNEIIFGYDLATSPIHQKALAVGRDSGLIIATEPIRLQQEIGKQAGFVARIPLYRNHVPTATVAQRRAAIYGFASIAFRVDNLMQELVDRQLLPHLAIRINDAGYFNPALDQSGDPVQIKALFDSDKAYPDVAASGELLPRLHTRTDLNIGERRWQLDFVARDGQRYGRSRALIVLVASGGVIISLLSAALLVVFRRRRILAEQLSRALDEQHAIQDNAVVGMVLVVNRIIMRSNRGIEDLLGYPPGGLIGQPTRCFFKSEDDYNALGEAYRAIRKGERWQNEWQLVRSDGSTIWCMMHGKAIDPSHYDKGSVWVIHDISARRQAEAALVDANNRLERSLAEVEQQKANVQEAHDDLAAVIAKLQRAQANLIFSEKMASLGSLVAGIAHELNTPIGNSLLAATALADRVTEFEQVVQAGTFRRSLLLAHLDDTRAACTLLAGSLHKAAHLISSFKQVAVDQTSDDRRHFDLRSVLQDTMATYAVQLKRRNCEATLDAPSAVTMDSYPGSIGQIFNNLIGNSLLHAFEGHNNAIIHISVREIDAGHIEITFQDNGAGMEADTLHRIFDPFFTTKMGQGGSGLGMNIVYNIVTGMLGGAIRVDSTLGQGSTITITIPKVAPSNPPPAKAALF